ncbi:MAG: ABC transporter permease, partial [Pseudomonadota bacterium]|nr:ABC transporter permease [Pseudomonadota bacterium]
MEKKFNFKTRQIGFVNWLGAWTLLVREVSRFIKVYSQTIVAPVVTTMMFFIIFSVVIKRGAFATDNITDFSQFLAAGLIMMAMLQNAFANTSSSLVISKIQGNIVDILMPPLTAGELTFSYAIGGVVRGFVVGISVFFVINWFVGFETFHFGFIIFYIFFSSLALSLL